MSSRAVRIVGYTFIGVVIATCSVLVLATALEYSGLSKKLNRQWFAKGPATPEANLYETDYYGKPLDDDPYRLFKVQHLHPYYLFSLPWRPEAIQRANNEFVLLNEEGFRNSGVPDSAAAAILLGGSTAFGLASTGDSHTLAYRLSELTEYKFANRNSPSWNSHQELVAAVKFPYPYKLSVSFSLANDIQSYCYESGDSPFIDQPESFARLAGYFDDVRAKPLAEIPKEGLLEGIFPQTIKLVGNLTGLVSGEKESDSREPGVGKYCPASEYDEHARKIVQSFLQNQRQLARLAEATGGRHLAILQPIEAFSPQGQEMLRFAGRVYADVMRDPWCQEHCLNLLKVPGLDQPVLFDGTNAATAHFVDSVHLTDRGVEAVLQAIVPFIASQH